MAIQRKSILAYCSCATAFSLISSAFSFYYVKVFMNIYHIEEKWFQMAQLLYLVWNAINDPLFAYIQDSTNLAFTKTRRESIMYSGPLFALSFIIPWIPWGESSWAVGLHLIVALFLWDTMFTFVGLAMCALFSEISKETEDRITLTRYAQCASLLGSASILLLEFTSDSLSNFRAFQITTACVAFCSWLLFRYTGKNAHTEYDRQKMSSPDTKDISHDKTRDESYCKLTAQILRDRDFVSFVITNFCQEFHRTFLGNFMAIICDQLILEDQIPRDVRKMFYGINSMASPLMVIFGTSLIRQYSYFKVIRFSFIYKVMAGVMMYLCGQGHPWILMLFLLLDRCSTNAAFSLFNLPLADIADNNMKKYNRGHPISSMVFGTNALIVKPAISLAPMLVVAILNSYGYSELQKGTGHGSIHLSYIMFILVCLFPILIGSVQFISWSYFTIRVKTEELYVEC